jgi:hypothetical protein
MRKVLSPGLYISESALDPDSSENRLTILHVVASSRIRKNQIPVG